MTRRPVATIRRAALAGLVLVAAVSACGCQTSRKDYLARSRAILPEVLRDDHPALRALALEAYRHLGLPVPEAELETIITRDVAPARVVAMLAMAEQAQRNDLKLGLLKEVCGGIVGREASLDRARRLLPEALRSTESHHRIAAMAVYGDLRQLMPEVQFEALLTDSRTAGHLATMTRQADERRTADLAAFNTALRRDDDASVRLAAAYGLALLGDTSHMMLVAEGLWHADPAVRRNAALVLGLLGNSSAIPMLAGHLGDKDAQTRLNVAEAMARLGDSSGLPKIRLVAADSESPCQVNAILALGRVGSPGVDVARLRELQARGRRASVGAKAAAIGARAMLGDYMQIGSLAEVALGKGPRGALTPHDRAFALQLLARSAYGPLWREVGQCLGDKDPAVRLSAAWAMLSFSSPRADAVRGAIASSPPPRILTQEDVLRPAPESGRGAVPGSPLDPSGSRRNSGFRSNFP